MNGQKKAEKYESIQDFRADILLMMDNAKTFNRKGSAVYKDAMEIQVWDCDHIFSDLQNVVEEFLLEHALKEPVKPQSKVGAKNEAKIETKLSSSSKVPPLVFLLLASRIRLIWSNYSNHWWRIE